mmetsp:Transcript_49208/g.123922  ORF Transcript_49208/g.123922 Transcript_49208/m.123922 type:complete len:414 (+) Transcript_49208:57-1298(+)
MSETVTCSACPNHVCPNIDSYREHCETKWHKFNLNRRMMGYQVLTEEEYMAQHGGDPQDDKKKQHDTAHQQKTPATPAIPEGMVNICIAFQHSGEKWSHKFLVRKGSTIMDLKRAMVKTDSPQEDLVSFSLKRGMMRMTNFETLDQCDTFDFHWVGQEEGQRLLDRDTQRKAREDEEAKERERRKEELAQETRRLQAAAEAKQKEGEERKRREEEEKKEAERKEEETRKQEEARRKEKEEKRRDEEKRREEQRRLEEQHRKEQEEKRRKEQEEKRQEEERRREEQRRLDEVRRKEQEEKRQDQERRKKEEDKALEGRRVGAETRTDGSNGPGAHREIVVWIDRDLDLKATLRVKASTTVKDLKEELAKMNPTALASPEDFGLVDPLFGAELAEGDVVEPTWDDLEIFLRLNRG